jgi:hypothetical protein
MDLFVIPWSLIFVSVAKSLFLIFLVVLPMVSYTVYAERRVSALIQDRVGPNRTGFPLTLLGLKRDYSPILGGLGQPIADVVKFLLKEDFVPGHVNKPYFWLAPCLAVTPALITLSAIPFGSTLFGEKMVIADINVGLLFMFAISSVGGLRHRSGRMVIEFEVFFPRRHPFDFTDDQLRTLHGNERHSCVAHCPLERADTHRRLPGARRLADRAVH